MKLTKRISLFIFLLASLVLTSKAQAQTIEDTSRISDPIFAARSAYTSDASAGSNGGIAKDAVDIAQLSRNRPSLRIRHTADIPAQAIETPGSIRAIPATL